ncbi:MAG: PqiC family protein [Puniceicoccales bacterium]|jgi:uncharacterized lipoprotein YmbA|nr:PqiC family protein [Puniceicoccales bacterium]
MKYKAAIALLLCSAACSGCKIFVPQSDRSVFYTLGDHSISKCKNSDKEGSTLAVVNILLGQIPSYADCPYIVIKDSGNKLIFSDVNRWAEPFGDACIRILHDELVGRMDGTAMVVSSMHTIGNTLVCDYRLSIDFDDLIYNDAEKKLVMKCTWTFFDYNNRKQLCIHKYVSATHVDVVTCDNIVNATKTALVELADVMAEKIKDFVILPRSTSEK